jgi:hypothetical protein
MLRGDGVIRRPKGQISARFRCGGVDLADGVANLDGSVGGSKEKGRAEGQRAIPNDGQWLAHIIFNHRP